MKLLFSLTFFLSTCFVVIAGELEKKVDFLLKKAWECYEKSDYTCMIDRSKEVLDISKEHNIPKGIAESYYYLGIAYFSKNDMNNALKYTRLAVEYSRKQNNYRWIVYSYTLLGEIFRSIGKYKEAMYYFKESMEYAEKNKNKKMIPVIMLNIGNIYFERKDYKSALSMYEEALELAENIKLRKSYISLLNFNIGITLYNLGMVCTGVSNCWLISIEAYCKFMLCPVKKIPGFQ